MIRDDHFSSPTRLNRRETQTMHGSGWDGIGQLIDNALANLNQKQAQALAGKAANEALRLEVKMREQHMDYVAGRRAVDEHNEAFATLDKSGKMIRQKVVSTIHTGAGSMRIESKSGATCFVASAAYQDPNHPDVMFLRWVRDEHLKHSPAGRSFIDWYWRVGPRLAKVVSRREWLRSSSKIALQILVQVLQWGFRIRNLGQ